MDRQAVLTKVEFGTNRLGLVPALAHRSGTVLDILWLHKW